MRIIGGKYRSRVLAEFAGDDVRPTSDRTKESLFNILALKLYGARVLDLFCGSGALGLESLSRGAKEVVFNDSAKASIAILKKNLSALKIQRQNIKERFFRSIRRRAHVVARKLRQYPTSIFSADNSHIITPFFLIAFLFRFSTRTW